jgi:membrane protease YdiL (CAAX protease family)
MTLRQYLDDRCGRARIAIACVLVIWCLAWAGIFVAGRGFIPEHYHRSMSERMWTRFTLFFLFIASAIAVNVAGTRLMRRTPCPRCGLQLGEMAGAHLAASYRGQVIFENRRQGQRKCPNCGLSLDEESGPT